MLLVIGGLFGSFIGVSLWHDKNAKSPLHWCVWEITKHENYNDTDYSYTYEVPSLPEGEKQELNVYSYIITVYTEERIGVWYCFIECHCNHVFYKTVHNSGGAFQPNEVKLIDCDLAYETLLEE